MHNFTSQRKAIKWRITRKSVVCAPRPKADSTGVKTMGSTQPYTACRVAITQWRLLLVAAMVAFFSLGRPISVRADSPAVTDFGQDLESPVFSSRGLYKDALFLTLYQDGREDCQIRAVPDDAVVSFAGQHKAWSLDGSLTWFWQIPVYVRIVHSGAMQDGTTSA